MPAPPIEDVTDVLVKAALERLKVATNNRDLNGYTEVKAADVLAVCAALMKEKTTGVTAALLKGAAGAGNTADVWQKTEHLLHLIERAG